MSHTKDSRQCGQTSSTYALHPLHTRTYVHSAGTSYHNGTYAHPPFVEITMDLESWRLMGFDMDVRKLEVHVENTQ